VNTLENPGVNSRMNGPASISWSLRVSFPSACSFTVASRNRTRVISIESALIPEAGVSDLLLNAEVAFVPSVSAVIVTVEVVDGVVDEEHPFRAEQAIATSSAKPLMDMCFFIVFFMISWFNLSDNIHLACYLR